MSEEQTTATAEPKAFIPGLPYETGEEFYDFANQFGETGSTMKDMTALTPESMEIFYMVGYNHYTSGKYDEAEKIFTLLCTLDHFDVRFWKGLGACRELLKKYEEAVQCYSYLTLLDFKDPYPPYHVAKNLLGLNRIAEAKSALQAAIYNSEGKEDCQDVYEKAVNLMNVIEKAEAKALAEVGEGKPGEEVASEES